LLQGGGVPTTSRSSSLCPGKFAPRLPGGGFGRILWGHGASQYQPQAGKCPRAAAQFLRRVPLQPPGAGVGMDHQPWADGGPGGPDVAGGRAAGRDGLCGRLDHRRGGGGLPDLPGHRRGRVPRGVPAGRAGGADRRCPGLRSARHLAVPGAAAGVAGAAGQRDDPGKGADPGTGAVRGLGVLRQADPGPPRGVQPAAVAGQPHLRPGPEPDLADQLRRAAGAVFAVGRVAADRCRPAQFHRRDPVLGRGVFAVPLALARHAHADLPRNGAGARGQRQGSEAVRARSAAVATLSRHFHPPLRARPLAGDPPRRLGISARPGWHRCPLWRLCVDRGERWAR
jgi:hypothetical protein